MRYTLKTPYRDGTTHIMLEPLDLIDRRAQRARPKKFDFDGFGTLDLGVTETHLLKLEQAAPNVPLLQNVGELNSGANGRLGQRICA